MKKYILSLLFICSTLGANAQWGEKSLENYFRPPMDGVLLPSANFAETRTNHFHSGVDIKTGGVEGKPIYAAADGYICRIGIAPRGFGRVLYINHPNGMTTVYAHMQKFTPAIEKYVTAQRYKQKKHAIDIHLNSETFPVKKAELIGHSGNSGSSSGPHLHYEVRDGTTQDPVNPITLGVVKMKDDIAPTIVRLHYIEVDTVRIVPLNSKPRAIEVIKGAGGQYTLKDTSALVIGPHGYFVLEVTDRKNDSHNTMGVYQVSTEMDGAPLFGFTLDRFSYANSKYVNSLCHFAMQKGVRNQLLRLALQANNRLSVFSKMKNRGALVLNDNNRHPVSIRVSDDSGNSSTLFLNVRKREAEGKFYSESDIEGEPVDCMKPFSASLEGLKVSLPEKVLYENIFYSHTLEQTPNIKGGNTASIPRYSPIYSIHDAKIPLHKAMSISIRAEELPADLHLKACLGVVAADGANISYAGGIYKDGWVTGNSSIFGRFCVVVDTIPPTITPNFKNNEELRSKKSIVFTIRDNFSGIASFSATIDGEWIIFEQQGANITHWFDPEKVTYAGGKHELEITVTDNKGNNATLKRIFTR